MRAIESLLRMFKSITEPSKSEPRYRVLFVCMGNICRSPTAEGVFRKLLVERAPGFSVEVDSAGTHAYHLGHAPDPRAQRAALGRGIDISRRRARKVSPEDFERFDWLIAMDRSNLELLEELCPERHRDRLKLFLEFAPALDREDVPDPYYGGTNGFEYVLDLAEEAAAGLLTFLEQTEREREARDST